jgi:hypothetical protein
VKFILKRAWPEVPFDGTADFVEVDADGAKRLVVTAVEGSTPADDPHDVVADGRGIHPVSGEHPPADAFGLAGHAQQEVLGADPAVPEGVSFLLGPGHSLVEGSRRTGESGSAGSPRASVESSRGSTIQAMSKRVGKEQAVYGLGRGRYGTRRRT